MTNLRFCTACNKIRESYDHADHFKNSHWGHAECDKCLKIFPKEYLLIHVDMCEEYRCGMTKYTTYVIQGIVVNYNVVACNMTFITECLRQKHIEAEHSFCCQICEYPTFEHFIQLEAHMKMKHGNHVAEFQCFVCATKFPTDQELTDHMEEKHTYKCTKCEETFQREDVLKCHQEYTCVGETAPLQLDLGD